jgi:phosphoglycolate phosphatase
MQLQAVIYDLDGTLIDSRDDLADAVNETLRRLGLAPLAGQQILRFVGEGAELLVRRALSAARLRDRLGDEPPEQLPRALLSEAMPLWQRAYGERLLVKTRLYPGVEALLLQGPPLRAVLTNKPGGFARAILGGLGVESAFQAVVGGDEAPRKPDPSGLLGLCSRLGVVPTRALLVGDSPIDVATARAAGVRSCAVTWGLVPPAELLAAGPDHTCESTAALAALLGLLAGGAGPR